MYIMMEKLIYIAGAYSSKTKEGKKKNIEYARRKAIKVCELGAAIICPHLNTMYFDEDSELSYEKMMQCDFRILSDCDAIFMLSNWKSSEGAVREREYAIKNNIPILYTLSEVGKFINKKLKRCYLTGKVKTKYFKVGSFNISVCLEEKVEELGRIAYDERMKGLFPVPKL